MTLSKYTLIGIFLLIMTKQAISLDVFLPKSALTSEKKSLNFLIDNYFKQYDRDKRFGRKLARKQIKTWNKHIKDWNNLNDGTTFYVYKNKFNIDVSLGKDFNNFSNEFINHDTESTTFKGEIDYNFKYWSTIRASLTYQDFSYYENDAQSAGSEKCLSVAIVYKHLLKNSPGFSVLGIINREQMAHYALLNQDSSLISSVQMTSALSPSKTTLIYLGGGIEYKGRFEELLPNRSYIKIYKSLSGTIESTNSSDQEDATAFKIDVGIKQFLYKKFWGELAYHKTSLDAVSTPELSYSAFSLQFGLHF